MTAAEQADQQLVDDSILSDDHLAELFANRINGRGESGNHFVIGKGMVIGEGHSDGAFHGWV